MLPFITEVGKVPHALSVTFERIKVAPINMWQIVIRDVGYAALPVIIYIKN